MQMDRVQTIEEVTRALAARRQELGLSQAAVASRAGVSTSTIARWEDMSRTPSREMLAMWAGALGVRLYWSIDMVTTEVPQ